MKRILLLSAPIGSGHIMAAEALKQELETKENIEVVHGNIFTFLPEWVGNGFLKSYLQILKLCPWLYGIAYSSGDSDKGSFLWLRDWFNRWLLNRGAKFLEDINPDIVIATHATPLGLMSLYKKQHPQLKLYAVVPDYNIHHWWACEGVDAYFVADEDLTTRLPENAAVEALGLPLRASFNGGSKEECRKVYGFGEHEKVLLIMGGGDGLLPMEQVLQVLVAAKLPNLHVIAITGHNNKLLDKLKKSYFGDSGFEFSSFREDIPQLMTAADIIITKAGAVTAAEVLACDLSYVIYKPLPGQEAGNAKFLARKHGAMIANSVDDIVKYVENPQEIKQLGTMSLEARKSAAKHICAKILQK